MVYNGSHPTPTFSGAGALPANKTLSGIKSKEYKGGQYGELLFDDSTGQVRTKLSSEHAKTQLNLGYLIHPRTNGKGESRGEGFELRTDAHGAIRAGHGLLLTTEAKGGAAGKQLDRNPASSQLESALELAKSLGEVTTKQLADTIETGEHEQTIKPDNSNGERNKTGHLHHHVHAAKSWEAGSNTDADGKSKSENQAGQQPLLMIHGQDGLALKGAHHYNTRIIRSMWHEIGVRYKAVVGEHMAHYHHMKKLNAKWKKHGAKEGTWDSLPMLVTENGGEESPIELFPEHLKRVNLPGIDGLWSLGGDEYHFVEAKAYASAGAMYGLCLDKIKEGQILQPPKNLTERQVALWSMLGQPKKGLQMSEDWINASTAVVSMRSEKNMSNRWVYVFFAIPGNSKPPKEYAASVTEHTLKQGLAPGILEHISVSTEVVRRVAMGGDIYELALHDQHKEIHGYSDVFDFEEIDRIDDIFKKEKRKKKA